MMVPRNAGIIVAIQNGVLNSFIGMLVLRMKFPFSSAISFHFDELFNASR